MNQLVTQIQVQPTKYTLLWQQTITKYITVQHLLVICCKTVLRMAMSVTDVVDGDRLNLHCRIEHADYIEYLTPHYDWTVLELDDNEQQRVHITSLAAENSGEVYVMASWPTVPQLHCSVYFNRSAGSSYSDVASNAPSYRGNCTTNTINVLSPPRDVRVNDTSTAENKSRQLLCSAAGRPTPSYEWYRVSGRGGRDEDQLMVSGELLVLTDIGRHEVRCVTINVIRGVMHKITSDTVIVDVLPPRHQNDTDMITDSEVHRNRNNDRITTGSVNEAIVYEGNAMSRPLINSPYFVAGMCSIAVVMLFITIPTTVAVVVRCRHRTDQKDGNVGTELETAASSTWTLPNTQGDSQNGEESEHGDERIVEDDRSSAVYDEIATTSSEFSQPPTAASEQYSKLISSDVAPVVASGTNVDVYSPLQRDVSNTLKKITIAIGKCDVSIVFNGDGETGTVPSI